ncbi:unnamed protein product [Rhizoctonia solani]|uniref:Uncharacterized protein n=1 Tax=Rhizoctonia solani TaxID=456999 RepID=A0A8H3CAC7_9AGAM|nr:unnamed protein product [Rhizoctonia solani]
MRYNGLQGSLQRATIPLLQTAEFDAATSPNYAGTLVPLMSSLLSIEHTKSKLKNSSPAVHSFIIRSSAGNPLYALEPESKHVHKIVRYSTNQSLAKVEWRGNNKNLVQMGDSEPGSSDTERPGKKLTWRSVLSLNHIHRSV